MLSGSTRCSVERIPRRDLARALAAPQRDPIPLELGSERVGHSGPGCHRRGLLLGHTRSPRTTRALSYSMLVRSQATRALHRLLDALALRPLGRARPGSSRSRARSRRTTPQVCARSEQTCTRGRLFGVRNPRGRSSRRASMRLFTQHSRHIRSSI